MRQDDNDRIMFLDALEEAGGEGGEGYDEALEIYYEKIGVIPEDNEDDLVKDFRRSLDEYDDEEDDDEV